MKISFSVRTMRALREATGMTPQRIMTAALKAYRLQLEKEGHTFDDGAESPQAQAARDRQQRIQHECQRMRQVTSQGYILRQVILATAVYGKSAARDALKTLLASGELAPMGQGGAVIVSAAWVEAELMRALLVEPDGTKAQRTLEATGISPLRCAAAWRAVTKDPARVVSVGENRYVVTPFGQEYLHQH